MLKKNNESGNHRNEILGKIEEKNNREETIIIELKVKPREVTRKRPLN